MNIKIVYTNMILIIVGTIAILLILMARHVQEIQDVYLVDMEYSASVQRHRFLDDNTVYHCYETNEKAVRAFYKIHNIPLTPFAKLLLSEKYECPKDELKP